MRDLKSLYLEAKKTGTEADIDHYMEAVNDLLNNDPLGYISNLEYIISSSTGLQTLNEFVEKHGMPLACVDTLEACLEKCIEKCEASKKDPSAYKKVQEEVQKARSNYDESFAMFEYYSDTLPENYVEAYYGKNDKGIPNRKLVVGMISKFGEACIPDVLLTAKQLGGNAVNTVLEYLSTKYGIPTADNQIASQWILESVKNIGPTLNESAWEKMYNLGATKVISGIHERRDRLYKESVIMGNDSLMMEYSEDEINAIQNLIAIREYQMVSTPNPYRAKLFQEEVYKLYEEFDGLIPDNEELITEKADAKKVAAKKIAGNMKALATRIKKAVAPSIRGGVHDNNSGKGVFDPKRVVQPSVQVTFGDRKGPYAFGFIKNKVKKNLDEILDFSSEWIKGIVIYIQLTTDTGAPIRGAQAEQHWKVFAQSVQAALKDMIKAGEISLTGNEPNNYVSYLTTWRIPVFMSKTAVIEDVDLDFDESSQEFLEMIADSVIPMLPGEGHDIMEAQWQYNTMNKKTGAIPGYLKNNHDLGYGEDEPPKPETPKDDYSLDDFKRPSADKTEPEPLTEPPDDEPDPEKTDKPSNGVNNYYYYTYNNSLNRNQGSFNRSRSDDHSVHTSTRDDHSYGKRVNSDDVNSHNTTASADTKDIEKEIDDKEDDVVESESVKKKYVESMKERHGSGETFNEAVGDADDGKPESDHPIKDVLTDIDRNLVGKQQKAKKAVQNVQNAGRAFMKPINRTTQWIGNMINQWKDADENNIKEKMADPHARKNIFTAVGSAIKYGSLLKAGILLNPVFLFLSVTKGVGRHKKEFRIRNEMIGELKTELQVIDEKIKDADRAGDNKAKYQLMRLKNEINKKLLRVGGDKQWKKIL